MYTALMLGAGHSFVDRRAGAPDLPDVERWYTLDMNSRANPDFVFNLNHLSHGADLPGDDQFDEIHSYEVMEHFGQQGDFAALFSACNAIWRKLRSGGLWIGSCPAHEGRWVWGDPGHTRYFGPETIHFLVKEHYTRELGKTAMSDYREYIEPHWWTIEESQTVGQQWFWMLRKDG